MTRPQFSRPHPGGYPFPWSGLEVSEPVSDYSGPYASARPFPPCEDSETVKFPSAPLVQPRCLRRLQTEPELVSAGEEVSLSQHPIVVFYSCSCLRQLPSNLCWLGNLLLWQHHSHLQCSLGGRGECSPSFHPSDCSEILTG